MLQNELVAAISIYNDIEGAKRLYPILNKLGIPSVWCDGRFDRFPMINNSDFSTDGTLEYLEDKVDTRIIKLGGFTEPEKKTALFKQLKSWKYALFLGADEWPEGDVTEFMMNVKMFDSDEPTVLRLEAVIAESDTGLKQYTRSHNQIERLFIYPHRIETKFTHWCHFIDDNPKAFHSMQAVVKGLVIVHDQSIRSKLREKQMDNYQIEMKDKERYDYLKYKQRSKQTPK